MTTQSAIEWGVNGHPFWSDYSLSITNQLNLIKQMGLTSYRVDIYDSSASTISELSSLVTQATAMGITILPVIGASPSQFSSESAAYSWGVSTGAALAKALPGLTWELGNELDLFSGGNTNMTNPTQYNTTNYDLSRGMISGLYAGIHQADPTSQGMVNEAGNDFGFLTRLASDGVHWDITSLHWYGNVGNGSNLLATAATFGKPIEVTEFNSLAGSLNGDSTEQSYLSSEIPYLNSVASTYNIKAAYVYELLDQSDMTSTEAHYGLATTTGTLKPAGTTVETTLASLGATTGGTGTTTGGTGSSTGGTGSSTGGTGSSTGNFTDSYGDVWTLIQSANGLQIAINGVADAPTQQVKFLAQFGNTVYQENSAGNWYASTPSGAITGGNATWTQVSAPNTTTSGITGSTGSITDGHGNVWTLIQSANGLQIAINGVADAPTQQVLLLEQVGNTLYQENSAGNWYACTPSGTITGGNATWTQSAPNITATGGTTGGTTGSTGSTDTLVIHASGDSWNGNPEMVVTVDGKQVGGPYQISVSHAAGQWEDITIQGTFTTAQQVQVSFINDAYGGTSSTDRNLYIGSIALDGHVLAGTSGAAALTSNGSVTFNAVGMATGSPGPVIPTPDAHPTPTEPRTAISPTNGTGTGTSGADTLNATHSGQTLIGNGGDDIFNINSYTNTKIVEHGPGISTVVTTAGSYTLPGVINDLTGHGTGNQTLIGNAGNNVITGANGNDTLIGGGGNDTFVVGTGANTLTGGGGTHELFVFSSGADHDNVITDFHSGRDMLDLRPVMKAIGYQGADPFADNILEVVHTASGDTSLMIDPSGTAQGWHTLVTLQHVSPVLTAGVDFVWH